MRLLQIGSEGELAFTKDLIHDKDVIPHYAILSHTWANDPEDEVIYKDIKKQRAEAKPGYQKILFCKEQAERDGLDHFWVDTCCIDKTNAAELTESINSMFRWYQEAAKCYAFLSDVNSGRANQHEPTKSSWEKEFRASKWFTRGWTLQELIAPSVVEFFSSDQQLLGDKHSLRQTVYEITGVPISILEGEPLSTCSVDERIAWARARTTSKKEDKAYSVLGLLSMSMPVIYGEGETAAFDRLYSELERRSGLLRTVLEELPVAHGAAYDSHVNEHDPLCHPDTRTEVLREIKEWARDAQSEPVYWLNGMAGTGKSTISRTLAHWFSNTQTLGATFFFKRGEGDRAGTGKLFTTVASRLLQQLPEMTSHVRAALKNNPQIIHSAMKVQFETLILKPISEIKSQASAPHTRLVIIDALDECEREEDIKVLINLLSTSQKPQHLQLKFFLTSRPELPIRLGFKAVHGTFQNFILHEVGESVIKHDIAAYLRHQLGIIREQFNQNARKDQLLSADWPCSSDFENLVQMAVPLFIFASTISRFIADGRVATPAEQLEEVLKYQTKSQESQLDATYLPILHQMVAVLNRRSRERVIERFHTVVGSMVTLANPLSVSALAGLLQLPLSTVNGALETLHSVLSIPHTALEPVQLLHLSFRDFLVDPERRKDAFWVDEKETHRRLTGHCLHVLGISLKDNLCNVSRDAEVSSISMAEVDSHLSPELQYACRFWTHHLSESSFDGSEMAALYEFLSLHLLQWLEALCWMRRFTESKGMIKTLQSLITPESSIELIEFLEDSMFFVQYARYSSDHPLQIYSSALMHVPHQSFSRHSNQHRLTTRIDRIFPIQGHAGPIWSVIVSGNGKTAASAAKMEVFVWSIDTGERIGELQVSMHPFTKPVFSPDNKQLALATPNGVTIWSPATGEHLATTTKHMGKTTSLAFSPDSKQMALATHGTVIIISAETGECLETLKGYKENITAVAFSPDSKQMALAIHRTVTIISAETGKRLKTLNRHADKIIAVAFSPDGKHVASAANEQVIIWSTETATHIRVFNIKGITTLRFDSAGAQLLTNHGSFAAVLQDDDISKVSFASQSGHPTTTHWNLSTNRRWIAKSGRRYLLLPNRLIRSFSTSGDTIAFSLRDYGYIIRMSRECE